jgi:hypothetical protein
MRKEYDFSKAKRGGFYRRYAKSLSRALTPGAAMQGIQYVTNDSGKKVAVQIDLKKYGQIWEDFCDAMVARSRRHESKVSLEQVEEKLRRRGKKA